jgi:hypothetical protein
MLDEALDRRAAAAANSSETIAYGVVDLDRKPGQKSVSSAKAFSNAGSPPK